MTCAASAKVSVIIPCFNHGEYLAEAVQSALDQTCPPFEVIVVDDGSNETGTLSVLEDMSQSGINVIRTQNNGLAAARNNGIKVAQGDYILPLDADDRIAPGYLEKASSLLDKNPEVGIAYGRVELFEERSGVWEKPSFSEQLLLFENMIVACAMFRRKDWEAVGGYSKCMTFGWEDWDFWLSLIERGLVAACLPEVMFYYRIREKTMTTRMTFSQKLRMAMFIVWRHKMLYIKNYRHCIGRLLKPFFREVPSPR